MPSRKKSSRHALISMLILGAMLIVSFAVWIYYRPAEPVVLPQGPQPVLPPRPAL